MADAEIVEALAQCLEALRHGHADVQACLDRFPTHRAELEALLEVVRLIPRLPTEIAPSPRFCERTRRLLLSHPNGPGRLPTDWGWQHPHLR